MVCLWSVFTKIAISPHFARFRRMINFVLIWRAKGIFYKEKLRISEILDTSAKFYLLCEQAEFVSDLLWQARRDNSPECRGAIHCSSKLPESGQGRAARKIGSSPQVPPSLRLSPVFPNGNIKSGLHRPEPIRRGGELLLSHEEDASSPVSRSNLRFRGLLRRRDSPFFSLPSTCSRCLGKEKLPQSPLRVLRGFEKGLPQLDYVNPYPYPREKSGINVGWQWLRSPRWGWIGFILGRCTGGNKNICFPSFNSLLYKKRNERNVEKKHERLPQPIQNFWAWPKHVDSVWFFFSRYEVS